MGLGDLLTDLVHFARSRSRSRSIDFDEATIRMQTMAALEIDGREMTNATR